MQFDNIIKHIGKHISFTDEETSLFKSKLIHRKLRKRQYLLQSGDVCRHYTYVNKGFLRLYYIDENDNEHNLLLATEDKWITDIGSFHLKKPSSFFIDALEPSEVFQIKYSDLINLYLTNSKYDRIFRVYLEYDFIALQQRLLLNISSTAEHRYLVFCEMYPHLLQRLPLTHIASYIGITPEFLSKIRNKLSKKI